MNQRLYFLLVIFITCSKLCSATNPEGILDTVKAKISRVKDYSADVNISVDVTFIRIPVKQGKLYFRQPDKIRLDSKGFAMIPKKGMGMGFAELFSESYSAIWIKTEKIEGKMLHVIKVIPESEKSDVVLATLWIDRGTYLIHKADVITRSAGKSNISMVYPAKANPYDLPGQVIFRFEVNKTALPIGITGEFDREKPKTESNKPQTATLQIKYNNYKVNQGLTEDFFRQKQSP